MARSVANDPLVGHLSRVVPLWEREGMLRTVARKTEEEETTTMSRFDDQHSARTGVSTGWKLFVVWTVFSALAVWLGLSVSEGLAVERCHNDGQAWNWKAWSCAQPNGTIILPPGLRRAGSD